MYIIGHFGTNNLFTKGGFYSIIFIVRPLKGLLDFVTSKIKYF